MRGWKTLGLLSLLLGCGDEAKPKKDMRSDAGVDAGSDGGTRDPDRLDVDGRFFRDATGRALILRGINARVEGVFDVTFDDGRVPVEEVPELTSADCKRMAELGFNLLRLPINWSGIEPERDVFDEAYLERVDGAIDCARKQGIYVLVDLHQDAYSKEIGEDGAPLWAIVPPPEMLLEGPLTADELFRRRISPQARAASASFFEKGDPHGLQAEYFEMLEHVAKRYASEPFVVGIDLYNEPVTTDDLLVPFNKRAGEAVRKVAPELLVVFEPDGLWSRNGGSPVTQGPYPHDRSMYAPHLYEAGIGSEPTREGLLPAFEAASKEAKAWGTPWLVGEFGSGPSAAEYAEYLQAHYDLQDEFLVSSALWLWKETTQDSWGLYDHADGGWQERPDMVALVSRPHAQRIAGTPKAMRFEGTRLTFAYEDALDVANLVFIPERFVVQDVTCDGDKVTPKIEGTRVEITCAAGASHEVEITLAGT